MEPAKVAWVVGGYFAGAFPSTWVVSRIRRSPDLRAAVRQGSSEGDAHVMITKYLGWGWAATASVSDVLKGFLWMLAVRHLGDQGDGVLAASAVAVVAGHSFPFFARDYAGRGLAASAGVLLVALPVQMLVAGALILLGIVLRIGGLFSTLGMASVAPVAALQGQPWPLIAMGGAIFGLILLRRLQGVREVVARGIPLGRAVLYRCLFDSSGPPRRRPRGERRHGTDVAPA